MKQRMLNRFITFHHLFSKNGARKLSSNWLLVKADVISGRCFLLKTRKYGNRYNYTRECCCHPKSLWPRFLAKMLTNQPPFLSHSPLSPGAFSKGESPFFYWAVSQATQSNTNVVFFCGLLVSPNSFLKAYYPDA